MSRSLPNYTLDRPILHTIETTLYAGRRDSDGAAVLVKTAETGGDRQAVAAKLRHEFQLLRELDVPGAPRPIGLEVYPGGRALILDAVAGEPLSEVLRRGRLDVRSALAIGVALARVLAGVHGRGVIYKRLCPQQILCDLAGPEVCLIDFSGASRLSQELGRATSLVGEVSDFAYISPEQTGRMNRTLDARSDLYSFGLILYELLAGAAPFARLSEPLTLIHAHIARVPTPLREVAPEVPEMVERIVHRLLAKTAEERYQTTHGVVLDLERCVEALARGESVAEFTLGSRDKDGKLRVPQRLYGREAELATLMAAFDRVHAGATELMLVSGYSGVGKSVLVREVNRPIAERGGVFVAGKFDQFNRSVPYAALGQAFRELTHLLLCESPGALADWKTRIASALGASGKLITDLVPELAVIVGPQPELAALGPAEAQHRIELTLRRFVRAISGPQHPLVLFLDDLQWIDPASLNLIHALLTDAEQSHLLIVGAYRDNEVGSAHLLTAALDTLRKSKVALVELSLQPLALASVTRLLADTLDQPADEVDPLARALHGKTEGNPFFLGQYLAELVAEKTLWFDAGAQRWRWNLQRVEKRVVADNVVALVMAKLRRLPAMTQHVVTLAAAIGHQFDAATLATISGMPLTDTFAALWPALETSVALPLGEDYRFLVRHPDEDGSDAAELRPQDVWFKFLHDRIQQAAYALTPESQLPGLHLRIGRLLLERHGGPEQLRAPALFEVARHLGRGVERITDPDERMTLARLDLAAGRQAKAASAYESAAAFFAVGASLLTAARWDSDYELAFALHAEHAACEYLSGRADAAEALLEALIPRARTDFHYAELCTLRATLHATQGRLAEVIEWSLKGLERLGIVLPTAPEAQQAAFMAELAAASHNLGDRSVAELRAAPVLDDPHIELALTILSEMTPTCMFAAPGLYGPVLMKQVNLSLKHGHTRVSAFGYVTYGFLLVAMLGQYELGHEFGRLALDLNEQFQNTRLTCQIHVGYGMGLHHNRPLREALEHSRIGYRAGLESGDVNILCFGLYNAILFRFALGDELLAVGAELEQFLEIATRAGETLSATQMTVVKQVIACLQGETRGLGLGSDDFDEEMFRAEQEVKGPTPLLCRYYVFKEMLHYLHGDHYRALEEGERAERIIHTLAGLYENTMHVFYLGLTLLALSRTARGELRQAYAERITRCQETLAGWATHCPENFAHRAALLRAEAADLAGDADASLLYEEAIAAAERSGLVSDLALANELAALHHLGRGRREAAGPLLHAARRSYVRWGANAKVAQLDQKHRALLFPEGPPQERYIDESEPVGLGHADSSFDAMTVLKVAQALAGEIVLTKLIEQIMATVTTRAGAQRGALILEQDGKLMIEAIISHDPDIVRVDVREPLEESQILATSIVRYVAHTRETVVLGDASRVERFGADRYIAANRPKSVLCLALTHRGRLIGLIYLENNLAANVFTVEQVDLIRMLAAHAAISVQNALLYANVERMTAELRASNVELSEVNRRLQSELLERERAEHERTRLQEEVIAVQNARLAELSTPLIPISDQIMVMPIIGTVDDNRANRLVEAALEGAHGSRAAVVILDITGLKQIDLGAAGSLMRTARALRLLGSAVVITGIRADIAQTLIGLGIDLTGVVTRGTLQDGIAHAMALVGEGKRR